jgi:hypothetical protein
MWYQQEVFMHLLRKKRNFPEFPVDLGSKEGQKVVKGIAQDTMHELFEAVHLLKNSKDHRATNVDGFDRAAFKEELVDALHYLFEICIASGISMDEFYDAYMAKGEVNVARIKDGY